MSSEVNNRGLKNVSFMPEWKQNKYEESFVKSVALLDHLYM